MQIGKGVKVKEEAGFIIRAMAAGDIQKALEIENQSFVSPWTEGMLYETLFSPISVSFAIEMGALLIGYIMLYSVEDEAHILNLAVHPAYRRKGYACRLIKHTIDNCKAKGVSKFFLEVRESNGSAKTLYMKLGFKVIGKRKKYYTETNEDALVMQLSLDNLGI